MSAAQTISDAEASVFAVPYLADQSILQFIPGGQQQFAMVKPSQHNLTALDIAKRFTGRRIKLVKITGREHLRSVK